MSDPTSGRVQSEGIRLVGCMFLVGDDYCDKEVGWRPANIPLAPFEWFCREHAVEIAQREGVYGVYNVNSKDVVEEVDVSHRPEGPVPDPRFTMSDGAGRVQTDHTGRGWVFGDEPCTYSGGCNLPIRTHFHEVVHPTAEVVVRFYDESAPARVPSDKGSSS